ncbi:hypothetical protein L9F63_012663, partial [Diploptera punctata]
NPPSSLPSGLSTPNSPPDFVKTPNGTLERIHRSSSLTVDGSSNSTPQGGSPGSIVENYSVPRLKSQNSSAGDSPT